MKFGRDQRAWLKWVFEAKKRFGVSILNYAVTSNHIHLIMKDGQGRDAIPRAMQLVAGRTGQEYNQKLAGSDLGMRTRNEDGMSGMTGRKYA